MPHAIRFVLRKEPPINFWQRILGRGKKITLQSLSQGFALESLMREFYIQAYPGREDYYTKHLKNDVISFVQKLYKGEDQFQPFNGLSASRMLVYHDEERCSPAIYIVHNFQNARDAKGYAELDDNVKTPHERAIIAVRQHLKMVGIVFEEIIG